MTGQHSTTFGRKPENAPELATLQLEELEGYVDIPENEN